MIESLRSLVADPGFPSLHVMLVHFPIAFFALAPLLDLACLVFRERTWLDRAGYQHSDELHVTEVFHRIDRRTLDIDITMEDPKVLAKPWVAETLHYRLAPLNWELSEISCSGDYLDFSSFEEFLEN